MEWSKFHCFELLCEFRSIHFEAYFLHFLHCTIRLTSAYFIFPLSSMTLKVFVFWEIFQWRLKLEKYLPLDLRKSLEKLCQGTTVSPLSTHLCFFSMLWSTGLLAFFTIFFNQNRWSQMFPWVRIFWIVFWDLDRRRSQWRSTLWVVVICYLRRTAKVMLSGMIKGTIWKISGVSRLTPWVLGFFFYVFKEIRVF